MKSSLLYAHSIPGCSQAFLPLAGAAQIAALGLYLGSATLKLDDLGPLWVPFANVSVDLGHTVWPP